MEQRCGQTTNSRHYWLKQMKADAIIDQVLGPPHGNWEGLSYGEVALGFIAYFLMACRHFLSPVEDWAEQHLVSLSRALANPCGRSGPMPCQRRRPGLT